ncbi:MAG TPA: germination protein YpeB [Firmicutes bacterium]|nr:germination protein YpeB [Bacillota bacterium]HHY97419.1 germination protein YpeB [Bacillota bacterium]
MKRNWQKIIMVAALAIALLWGLREYSLRRYMEVQAENQYQRAFQELAFHLDSLQTEIGKALVATSTLQRARAFSDVWRHAYSAQASIGQLPIGPAPLVATEKFLGKVGVFTYAIAQKEIEGKPVSLQEQKTLRDLEKQASYLSDRITRLRDDLDRKGIRWHQVGRALHVSTQVKPERQPPEPVNPVSKGLKMVEDGMKRFPEPDYSGTLPPEKVAPKALTGPMIGPDDAVRIARDFLGAERVSGMTIRVVSTVSTDPETYRVEVRPARGLPYRLIMLDVSRRGGKVLWMLDDKAPMATKISMDDAVALGLRFLESRGYRNMKAVFREKLDNIALITYAYVQNGIVIYPDQVKLRIALDNGSVLGVEATGYLTFHHTRTLPAPEVSSSQLAAKFSPEVEVVRVRPVVIMDDMGNEKLCYEFLIRLDGRVYLSYIDAVTGQEHKVQRMTIRGTEVV